MLTDNSANNAGAGRGDKSDHDNSADGAKPAGGVDVSIALADVEKAKSAAAEIGVSHNDTKPDPVGDQIKRCNVVAKGESVFKAANAHIFEGLMAAYPLYLMIKDDKAEPSASSTN